MIVVLVIARGIHRNPVANVEIAIAGIAARDIEVARIPVKHDLELRPVVRIQNQLRRRDAIDLAAERIGRHVVLLTPVAAHAGNSHAAAARITDSAPYTAGVADLRESRDISEHSDQRQCNCKTKSHKRYTPIRRRRHSMRFTMRSLADTFGQSLFIDNNANRAGAGNANPAPARKPQYTVPTGWREARCERQNADRGI